MNVTGTFARKTRGSDRCGAQVVEAGVALVCAGRMFLLRPEDEMVSRGESDCTDWNFEIDSDSQCQVQGMEAQGSPISISMCTLIGSQYGLT